MLHLLIVDDDVIVRKWLRLVFQPYPEEFAVAGAVANGREALELCRAQPVDVVITDMIMPDMDGMSFIQALREFDLDTQAIILSNYADFSLAQKGMSFGAAEYLLKGEITEEELLAVTRRVGKKAASAGKESESLFLGLTSRQVNRLLMGSAPEQAKSFDAALAAEGSVIWCVVFSQDTGPFPARADGSAMGAEWARQLASFLQDAQLPGPVYVIADHIAVALILMRDTAGDAGAFFERRIKLLPCRSSQPSFSVGTDGPVASAAQLEQAFAHACGAIRWRFLSGPGSVCPYEPPKGQSRQADLREETRTVRKLIQGGELYRLKKLLERVCARSGQYTAEDIDHLRRLFNIAAESLIHYTLIYCREAGETQLQGINPMAEIGGMLFLSDIMAWMDRLIDACHGLLQNSANDDNMHRVLAYMEQNYMNNLTLNQISEVAGFSPNYFCNLFKECTGKSVSAYLTDLRIQRAKQLLTATNKSVNLVAGEVGYESPSYFIKVFKDVTGVTPNHFRRANR